MSSMQKIDHIYRRLISIARKGDGLLQKSELSGQLLPADDLELLREFFDEDFYLSRYPDVRDSGMCAWDHYVLHGMAEDRRPRPDFDPIYYRSENLIEIGRDLPFYHWVTVGRVIGRPGCLYSQPLAVEIALMREEFDAGYYLKQNPDVAQSPIDPFEHFLEHGWREGRDPNSWFSISGYLHNNDDVRAAGINPFSHFLCEGIHEGRSYHVTELYQANEQRQDINLPLLDSSKAFAQHLAFASPGADYEELDARIFRSKAPQAKLLAYYLPQFHTIPENDAWWGKGFTEWRNVVRGQPRYREHRQPRIPEQLGFYDLSSASVIAQQVALAKSAGVYGFCFYYYSFNGRRILERPVETFLADKTIDFPFVLMWANENWTRTWDGLDRSVLLQQDYRPQDDAVFLADVARHFADDRYIRIDGRPLFFIYRPGQIPNAKSRINDWRVAWRQDHDENPLIFMAQGFDDNDPRIYGLDGAIEFPPHKVCKDMQPLNSKLEVFDPNFSGHVVSYEETVERSLAEAAPSFPIIKTVTPSWDNEARRPGRGMTLHGSTPAIYEYWLREAVNFSRNNPVYGENFVAVNAWNEWAEGAYLEPDVYYGAAYLNATARALTGTHPHSGVTKYQILVVGHDAFRHGAQLLVQNLIELLKKQFGFDVHVLVCGDGPLLGDYRKLANSCTTIHRRNNGDGETVAKNFMRKGITHAIVNTTVNGWLVPLLKQAGFRITSLIHELPVLIREYEIETEAKAIAQSADVSIFPAALVRDAFLNISGPANGEVVVRPQGLYRHDIQAVPLNEQDAIRSKLNIPHGAKVVINVGYADMRKGFDIFLRAAHALCAKRSDVYFLWVGDGTSDAKRWQMSDIVDVGLSDRVRLTGYTNRVAEYYAVADVFFLTSREDPFPSVVLEALAACVPVVAVRGMCGTNAIVETYGRLVEISDAAGQLNAIEGAFLVPLEKREQISKQVGRQYQFDEYGFALAQTVFANLPRVSVIIPNYNYSGYLETRLSSIFRQTHPIFELIILDDASTDNSVEIIRDIAARAERSVELVINEINSGSVFRQWRKGIELARGDYVWIAEADDDCEESFLQTLIERMVSDEAFLGFTDSWQVDSSGERLGDSYVPYLSEEAPGIFDSSFSTSGHDFASRFLSVKNVILNVSGAIFKRQALLDAMDAVGNDLFEYKVAGDWRLYAELCTQPNAVVVYEAQELNGHRRHTSSVTHALNNKKHFSEIQDVQQRVEKSIGELTEETKATRAHYLKKVSQHLGVTADDGLFN